MRHGALDVTDAHEVAHAQGPRIREREAAHDLVDEAGRAQRHHETEKYTDPLECIGLASRQVRVGHDGREQPQQRGDEPACRRSRLRIDPASRHPPDLDGVKPQPEHPDDEASDQHDQRDREQPGNGLHHAEAQVLDGRQQEPAQRLPPGPRVGKLSKHECQRRVHHDEIQADHRRLHHPALEGGNVHAVQHFKIGKTRLGNGSLGGRDELPEERPVDPTDHPQGRHADDESDQRDRRGAEQGTQSARLRGFFERNLQARDGQGGHTLNRLSGQVVHVRCRESQHDPRSDADQRAAFEQLRVDGARNALGDQVVQRPFDASRSLHRRSAQDVRLEEDDGPIDVREGERLAGWRRRQKRCHGRERRRLGGRRRLSLRTGTAAGEKQETQSEAGPSPAAPRFRDRGLISMRVILPVSRPRARTCAAPASPRRRRHAFATGRAASPSGV